ncbi:MAG: hypothetical protein Kapaf2KO_13390 [Candidatus Kapaibacteriales bacterium]
MRTTFIIALLALIMGCGDDNSDGGILIPNELLSIYQNWEIQYEIVEDSWVRSIDTVFYDYDIKFNKDSTLDWTGQSHPVYNEPESNLHLSRTGNFIIIDSEKYLILNMTGILSNPTTTSVFDVTFRGTIKELTNSRMVLKDTMVGFNSIGIRTLYLKRSS